MKLKYLFGVLLSALLMVGCANEDNTIGTLSNIALDKTYITFPESGGSVTVNVSATDSWQLSELPTWLTASVTSGTAGNTQLVLTADAVSGGREVELNITAGDYTQFLMVRQGSMEATTATVAEVIAGADGKTYRVEGTCTTISNTTYGNWYLQDETGEVYIYGTLYNGQEKMFTSLGIEEGDVVEVEGSKTTYNGTVELVNVTVINITKSLVKVLSSDTIMPRTGGQLEVKVAYKGSGAYAEVPDDCSWIHYSSTEYLPGNDASTDTAIVKFNIAENTGVQRSGVITFKSSTSSAGSSVTYTVSQEGVGGTVEKPYTVAEAIAAAQGGTDEVYVKGIVCTNPSISTQYGNAGYYISDDGTETNKLQIYRGYYLNGEKFTSTDQLKLGDEVIVVGKLKTYNGQAEMDSGNYIYSLSTLSTVAEVLAGTDNETYRVKGTCKSITSDSYGNWYLEDETGEILIYGTLNADGSNKGALANYGIVVGDVVEVKGTRTTYKGTIELKNVTVLSITKAE